MNTLPNAPSLPRSLAAWPAIQLLLWSPLLAGIAAMGATQLLADAAHLTRPTTALLTLAAGIVTVLRVHSAPVLRTTTGRRSLYDAALERADRIADWAGWETDADDDGQEHDVDGRARDAR
ncbi:hypothetical protein ABT160_43550 [Streptomyces sp. NPDC001941]|uniref:hypothetical protein n=1 Tax=Streptomyces sp. NPDC001941 TaxID=3154659 RepID=UPI00331D838F